MASFSEQCWYKVVDNKFKIEDEVIIKHGLSIDKCVECKFPILSESFQQAGCGSRYCKDCYRKMKTKFYCKICKDEDPNNIVHKKEDIFEDRAFRNDLLKMKFQCPDCHIEVQITNLHTHAMKDCNEGWTLCFDCEKMYKKNHECKKEDQFGEEDTAYKRCPDCWKSPFDDEVHNCKMNWESSCPYECRMENYSKDHREQASLKHLDKMWAKCKELKMTDCKKADDSLEYQTWYDSTVDSLKSSLQFDSKKLETLRNEVETLKKQLADEKHLNDEIIKNLMSQASEFLNTNFDGTIMWRLDNFSKLKEDASKGLQTKIFSPPFYTSRFGYKMCLLLYPNGDSSNNGKAISIFLVIMKGNYDALLRWPFKQKVTFMLIDQQLETNISHSFCPAANMPSFSMPQTDMNVPAGISSFVKFENYSRTLPERYAKNDSIFIHCIVDCGDLHE